MGVPAEERQIKSINNKKNKIMPNHIYQKLRIDNWNDEKALTNLKKQIFNEKGELDFNKIIPQTENIFNGSLGEKEKQMCIEEGRPNWYDWNRENWNTKLGAYSFELNEDDENTLSFDFQTAWNIPTPIMNKIFELAKGCEIKYLAVDEGGYFAVSVTVDEEGTEIEKDLKEHCNELLFAMG